MTRFGAMIAAASLAACGTPAVLRAPIAAPDFAPPQVGTTPLPRLAQPTGDGPIRLPDPVALPPAGVADPAAGASPAARAAIRALPPAAFEPTPPPMMPIEPRGGVAVPTPLPGVATPTEVPRSGRGARP